MPRPSGLVLPGDPLFNLKQENRIKELAFREARRVVERYGGGGGASAVTDLTATAHRMFYSDGSGDMQELAHGTSGHVLTSNGASAAPSWQAASGGGGGGAATEFGQGNGLSAKGSADTPDDEFDQGASGLDAKWTAVAGSSGTVSLLETANVSKYDLTTREGFLLMQAGSSGQNVQLRQDYEVPDGNGIIVSLYPSLLMDSTHGSNELWVGIWLNTDDAAPENGTYFGLFLDAQQRMLAFTGSTIGNSATGADPFLGQKVYFRIQRSGTAYYGFISYDGGTWIPYGFADQSAALTNIWLVAGLQDTAFGDPVPIQAVDWIRQSGGGFDPW